LIDAEGEQAGIVTLQAALNMAEEAGLDLVEIAPLAQPPVCRVMDFGKFKYQESKKAHEAKLKQKQIQVKEVKLRPATDENDYQIKLRNLKRFLEEGDKCKVTLRFRGREMAHQEFGLRQLERVKADLEELGQVEQMPKMEGRQMVMVIAPLKKLPVRSSARIWPHPGVAGCGDLGLRNTSGVGFTKCFFRHYPAACDKPRSNHAQNEDQERGRQAVQGPRQR
jgi:translation initiation factor IF-3